MELEDVLTKVVGDRRHERHLERSGRDHDLIGPIAPRCRARRRYRPSACRMARTRLPSATGRAKCRRVLGEVGHDVVAARVAVRIAGEGQTRQAAIASGRKQLQRVPPCAPSGRRLLRRLEDRELATLPSQEIPDRKTGLAAADNDHLAIVATVVRSRVDFRFMLVQVWSPVRRIGSPKPARRLVLASGALRKAPAPSAEPTTAQAICGAGHACHRRRLELWLDSEPWQPLEPTAASTSSDRPVSFIAASSSSPRIGASRSKPTRGRRD